MEIGVSAHIFLLKQLPCDSFGALGHLRLTESASSSSSLTTVWTTRLDVGSWHSPSVRFLSAKSTRLQATYLRKAELIFGGSDAIPHDCTPKPTGESLQPKSLRAKSCNHGFVPDGTGNTCQNSLRAPHTSGTQRCSKKHQSPEANWWLYYNIIRTTKAWLQFNFNTCSGCIVQSQRPGSELTSYATNPGRHSARLGEARSLVLGSFDVLVHLLAILLQQGLDPKS